MALVGWLIEVRGPQFCFLLAIPFSLVILVPVLGDYFEESDEARAQNARLKKLNAGGDQHVKHGGSGPEELASVVGAESSSMGAAVGGDGETRKVGTSTPSKSSGGPDSSPDSVASTDGLLGGAGSSAASSASGISSDSVEQRIVGAGGAKRRSNQKVYHRLEEEGTGGEMVDEHGVVVPPADQLRPTTHRPQLLDGASWDEVEQRHVAAHASPLAASTTGHVAAHASPPSTTGHVAAHASSPPPPTAGLSGERAEHSPAPDSEELSSQEKLDLPQNQPIVWLVYIMGVSGLSLACCSILIKDVFVNFLIAGFFGSVILGGFTVFLRPIIAKMNLFFFAQNVCSVSVHGAAFYFFTDTPEQFPNGPHFKPRFYISTIGIVGSCFSLLGMTAYNLYAKTWNYRSILITSNLVLMVLHLVNCLVFARWNLKLGIPDHYFMVCSSAIQSAVFQFSWMPSTVMLAQLVPHGLESTMYALLAGSANLSGGLSNYSGALLLKHLGVDPNGSVDEGKQFDRLWVATAIGSVLPTFTLFLVPLLIPDMKQTEKLLVDDPDSPTKDSIWERWLKRKVHGWIWGGKK